MNKLYEDIAAIFSNPSVDALDIKYSKKDIRDDGRVITAHRETLWLKPSDSETGASKTFVIIQESCRKIMIEIDDPKNKRN